MEYRIQIKSSDRQSNSGYHRSGKKSWWGMVKIDGKAVWATMDKTRGDCCLNEDATIELPADGFYKLMIGVGPDSKDGVREEDTIIAYTTPDGDYKATYVNSADRRAEITKRVKAGASYYEAKIAGQPVAAAPAESLSEAAITARAWALRTELFELLAKFKALEADACQAIGIDDPRRLELDAVACKLAEVYDDLPAVFAEVASV